MVRHGARVALDEEEKRQIQRIVAKLNYLAHDRLDLKYATAPQLRAGWVAQEFRGRCGDKHEYFSETPDLALVKAVIAHAARLAEGEDIVVAVFDVRRAYFYAKEKRDTFVELPYYVPAEFRAALVGKLRKAMYGTRPAAASWGDELRKGLVSCSLTVGAVWNFCFHNELRSVAGTVHGDDIFVAGPRQDIARVGAKLKKKMGNS